MKDKTAAGLLGIFLGELGIHWFYLGKNGKGIAYLLINLLLWWTIVVPIVFAIIVLIEGIMILSMNQEEFNAKYNNVNTASAPRTVNPQPQTSPVSPSSVSAPSNKSESLLSLKELLDKGILSQEEFDTEKKKILNVNG